MSIGLFNIRHISATPHIDSVSNNTAISTTAKVIYLIGAIFQDIFHNLAQGYNYFFKKNQPSFALKDGIQKICGDGKISVLENAQKIATNAFNFAIDHKKEIIMGLGALALVGMYYYFNASAVTPILDPARLLAAPATILPICRAFEKPVLALPAPASLSVMPSSKITVLITSAAAVFGALKMGLFSRQKPFFKENYYQTPSNFSSFEATHNQFNIIDPMPQACGSDSLLFLSESFGKHDCAKNLDEILENGAEADHRVREHIRGLGREIGNDIGLNFDELQAFNIRAPSQLQYINIFNEERTDIPIFGRNIQIKFFERLQAQLDKECGFLIYKGGATYALYKKDDRFYFFDSHGYMQNGKATPAYVLESSDLDALLNSIPMLTDVDKRAHEAYHQISLYKVAGAS